MKRCTTCSINKPLCEFYRDRRRTDGLKSQCKPCHSECAVRTRDPVAKRLVNRQHMRRARTLDPERFRQRERLAARRREQTEESRARVALNNAVARGAVQRPACCSACGSAGRVEAHHVDYSRPLDVEWLCTLCHAAEHFPLPTVAESAAPLGAGGGS